ncbi:hypothetical protein SDC9_61493 [bioreactor metagenome]|uniref:Glycosyl transferase family 1 domain-containing protein n=1 Tax=bioreactor metagenome TaxID=1076179 RepID=A0A644XGT2_9ZZZZ
MIAASYAEGFGLPLIEAAHFNLPIISRNIPVFREVAGDHAFYFDAKNGDELALQLKQWLGLFACKEHPLPGNLRALSWRQSTEELVSILKSIMITM